MAIKSKVPYGILLLTFHDNSCPIGERLVGCCSHCATALCLSTVVPGDPTVFKTKHRVTNLLDRKNPIEMDVATLSEVS